MQWLQVIIIIFLILEALNVIILYFAPEFPYGNSMRAFKAWEKSKQDPEIHNMVRYLVNWVAGTKLIFILLLLVILVTANEQTLLLTGIAMTLSIATFFWRLYPLIRKMDRADQLSLKNYSNTLGGMIVIFTIAFAISTAMLFIG